MKNTKLSVLPWVALAAIALLGIGWFTLGFWSTIQQTEHCTAVVRTRVNNPANKFIGASGGIVIYKPRVQNGQSSSARIKLVNGAHSIEAGWMVNPDVFGDDSPHLYTRFSAKGKTCINTQCHGFVQVQAKYPLGISARYSMAGGAQYVWYISIEKREEKWWVFLSSEKVPIGYWPAKLVTGLSESASVVEWGGEVTNPGLISPSPEMGNGKKARYDSQYSAWFVQVSIFDKDNNGRQNNPNGTEKAMSCLGQYTVLDGGYQGEDLGRLIFYGGHF